MSTMSPQRYALAIYGALRSAGRSRTVAAARAGRVLRRETWCRMVGHRWDWPLAEMLGTTGRPVCERCLTAAPRKEATDAQP